MGIFDPRRYRFLAALMMAVFWLASDSSGANALQQSAIFTIDIDSGETVKISHKDGWWLKYIVFWFNTNQQERLHLLEVGSPEPPRLLPGQSTPRNSDPVWSFDSKKVAFSSDR